MTEQFIESPCPVCGTIGVMMHVDVRELAYFGDHAQISLACETCGWRRTEFLPPEPSEPIGMRLVVNSDEHLGVRLVRSASSSIVLPEIGLEVHPGSDASGYVTNIEGVLMRFMDQVRHVLEDAEPGQQGDAEIILECLCACLDEPRSTPLTLELLDPGGHARMIHRDVETWPLSPEESLALPGHSRSHADIDESNE